MTQLQHAHLPATWGDWFERRARHYDDPRMQMGYYVAGEPVPHAVMQATIEDAWDKLDARSTHRLLDVGGGVGLFADAFADRVADIVVTDLAPAMLGNLRRRKTTSDAVACAAGALPFASESFDRVLCYSVFHYFSGMAEASHVLDELTRVTVPGGLLLIGDVPHKPAAEAQDRVATPPDINTTRSATASFPAFLKHNLSPATYEHEFFRAYTRSRRHACTILMQDISGKVSSSARFDIRIGKRAR